MTKNSIAKLVKLLKELKKDDLLPPKMPFEIWTEIMTMVPAPAVEVLITKDGKDFLLTERNDKYWNGWHIPGGFLLAKEKIEDACERLAQKELGISVEMKKVLMIETWKNHPYANALSIVCICEPKGEPGVGKFFTKIPDDTINQHKVFLKKFLKR